jgi:short-subunit dehydrogenase
MTDLIDLAGKTVIVTGASSGIGASTARLLHAAGAHPVLAARRADRLAALSAELGGALAVPTDLTDAAQVRDLAAATLDRHQRIDGLVNNAGASLHGPLDQVDPVEFSQILQLNVVGLLAMTQAVLPAMREQGFGRIVNISSGSTRRAAVGLGAYASTKTAVNMLSAVLTQELAGDGIAVSLLLPSITATEFADGMFALGAAPRPGMVVHSPDYVAGVVLRLLRTGEESFDIPHGPEQPDLARVPDLSAAPTRAARSTMVDRWRRSGSSKSPSTARNLSASPVSGATCWGTSYRRHRRGSRRGAISIARFRLSIRVPGSPVSIPRVWARACSSNAFRKARSPRTGCISTCGSAPGWWVRSASAHSRPSAHDWSRSARYASDYWPPMATTSRAS